MVEEVKMNWLRTLIRPIKIAFGIERHERDMKRDEINESKKLV